MNCFHELLYFYLNPYVCIFLMNCYGKHICYELVHVIVHCEFLCIVMRSLLIVNARACFQCIKSGLLFSVIYLICYSFVDVFEYKYFYAHKTWNCCLYALNSLRAFQEQFLCYVE